MYSSRKYYKSVFSNLPASPIYKKMCHSKCTPRMKFFMWLVVVDRLNNTGSMLLRRTYNVQPNANCVMCFLSFWTQKRILITSSLFGCPFAMTCWQKLGIQWNGLLNIYDKVLEAERQSSHPFFMEIVMIALWEIWNLRNFKFFDGGAPSIRL